jgi:uncharacterized protein YktB (UPF0637 family)
LGQEARVKTTSTDGTHVVEVVIEKLSRDEIREGVKRLRQLKVVREDLVQREKYIGELEGLAKQREALRQDAYKIGLDKLKVAEDQRDIEKMKREHYQDLYEELSKKRGGGFKCGLRAVFSLGMSRCG